MAECFWGIRDELNNRGLKFQDLLDACRKVNPDIHEKSVRRAYANSAQVTSTVADVIEKALTDMGVLPPPPPNRLQYLDRGQLSR